MRRTGLTEKMRLCPFSEKRTWQEEDERRNLMLKCNSPNFSPCIWDKKNSVGKSSWLTHWGQRSKRFTENKMSIRYYKIVKLKLYCKTWQNPVPNLPYPISYKENPFLFALDLAPPSPPLHDGAIIREMVRSLLLRRLMSKSKIPRADFFVVYANKIYSRYYTAMHFHSPFLPSLSVSTCSMMTHNSILSICWSDRKVIRERHAARFDGHLSQESVSRRRLRRRCCFDTDEINGVHIFARSNLPRLHCRHGQTERDCVMSEGENGDLQWNFGIKRYVSTYLSWWRIEKHSCFRRLLTFVGPQLLFVNLKASLNVNKPCCWLWNWLGLRVMHWGYKHYPLLLPPPPLSRVQPTNFHISIKSGFYDPL